MAAAELLDRAGYGCEISSGYSDVIVKRLMDLTGYQAVLTESRETFAEVASARGVHLEQATNPKTACGREAP